VPQGQVRYSECRGEALFYAVPRYHNKSLNGFLNQKNKRYRMKSKINPNSIIRISSVVKNLFLFSQSLNLFISKTSGSNGNTERRAITLYGFGNLKEREPIAILAKGKITSLILFKLLFLFFNL